MSDGASPFVGKGQHPRTLRAGTAATRMRRNIAAGACFRWQRLSVGVPSDESGRLTQTCGKAPEFVPSNGRTSAQEAAAEATQEVTRYRHSVRTNCGPIALRAFWSMHVEATNWSCIGHAKHAAALGLSPDSLRIWRDRLEDSDDETEWRLLLHPSAWAQTSSAASCAPCKCRLTPEAVDGRSRRRRFSNGQKRVIVRETEKPRVSVAQVCCRHGVATSMVVRRRVKFGLTVRKAPQLAMVTLADSAANELPALAILRDLVQPPDGTVAIELADGPRVFAPAGSTPAAVMRQLAAGCDAVSSQEQTAAEPQSEEQRHNSPNARISTEPSMPSCSRPSRVKLLHAGGVAALDHYRARRPRKYWSGGRNGPAISRPSSASSDCQFMRESSRSPTTRQPSHLSNGRLRPKRCLCVRRTVRLRRSCVFQARSGISFSANRASVMARYVLPALWIARARSRAQPLASLITRKRMDLAHARACRAKVVGPRTPTRYIRRRTPT